MSAQRDGKLAAALVALVCRCADVGSSFGMWMGGSVCRAICRAFRLPMRIGGRWRPSLRRWPGLSLAQVVKQHARRQLIGVLRRVVIGTDGKCRQCWDRRKEAESSTRPDRAAQWDVPVTDESAGATGAGACPTGGNSPSRDLLDRDRLQLLYAPWHALAASPASLHASDGGEAD